MVSLENGKLFQYGGNMKPHYPDMTGKMYQVTLRTLPDGNIDQFMEAVLNTLNKDINIKKIIYNIRILKELLPHWIIMQIEPKLWQEMVPIMENYRGKYRVDWEYKILKVCKCKQCKMTFTEDMLKKSDNLCPHCGNADWVYVKDLEGKQ